jgi:predicted DNA-binding antitoxin AbrB/MazE fold protein
MKIKKKVNLRQGCIIERQIKERRNKDVITSVVKNDMRWADGQSTIKRLIIMRPIKRIFADELMFLL